MAMRHENISASQGARITMLGKLKNAQRSHRMLKQKAEGLDMRRRGIAQQIITMKEKVGELMSEAYFSLAEARFICGNFSLFVINTASEACCHVQSITENVGGAILRSSELVITEELDQFKNIGFSLSSSHLKKVKENFRAVLKLLVQLASLEMSFHNLEVAVKITNSRVNGIEHVIIPQVEESIGKIVMEMDEMEREDFFRLKKVQRMKQVAEQRRQEEKTSTFQILSEIRAASLLSLSPEYSRIIWARKQRKKDVPLLVADTSLGGPTYSSIKRKPLFHKEMLHLEDEEDQEKEEELDEEVEEEEVEEEHHQKSYDSIPSIDNDVPFGGSLFTLQTMKEDDNLSTDGRLSRLLSQPIHRDITEKVDSATSSLPIDENDVKLVHSEQVLTFGHDRMMADVFPRKYKSQRCVAFEDEKPENQILQNDDEEEEEEEQEIYITDIHSYPKPEELEEKKPEKVDIYEKLPISSDTFRFQIPDESASLEDTLNSDKVMIISILEGLLASIGFHETDDLLRDSLYPTECDTVETNDGIITEEQKPEPVKNDVFQDYVVGKDDFDTKSTDSYIIEDEKSFLNGISEDLIAGEYLSPGINKKMSKISVVTDQEQVPDDFILTNKVVEDSTSPAKYDNNLEISDTVKDEKLIESINPEYHTSVTVIKEHSSIKSLVSEVDHRSINRGIIEDPEVKESFIGIGSGASVKESVSSGVVEDQRGVLRTHTGTVEGQTLVSSGILQEDAGGASVKESVSSGVVEDQRGVLRTHTGTVEGQTLVSSGILQEDAGGASVKESVSSGVVEDQRGVLRTHTGTVEGQTLVSSDILQEDAGILVNLISKRDQKLTSDDENKKSYPSDIHKSKVLTGDTVKKPEYSDRQMKDKISEGGNLEEYKSAFDKIIEPKSITENIHTKVSGDVLDEFKLATNNAIKQETYVIEYQAQDVFLPSRVEQKLKMPESKRSYVNEYDEEVCLGEFLFDTEAGLSPEKDEMLAMRDFLAGKHTIVAMKSSSDTLPISSTPPSLGLFNMMWEETSDSSGGKVDRNIIYDRQQFDENEGESNIQQAQFNVKELKQSKQGKSGLQGSETEQHSGTHILESSHIPEIVKTSSKIKYKVNDRRMPHVKLEMPIESTTDSEEEIQKILLELDKNPPKVEDKQSEPLCSLLEVQQEPEHREEKKRNPKTLWDTFFNE